MRLVPAIILAIAIILAPLVWLGGRALLSMGPRFLEGPAVDSAEWIDIQRLEMQIEALNQRLEKVERTIDRIAQMRATRPMDDAFPDDDDNQIPLAYDQLTLIANRLEVNQGLTVASPGFLEDMFGRPREVVSYICEPMTNETLKSMLVSERVGPVQVKMLRPAVDSLRRVLAKVRVTDEDLYDRINTSGSLCVRRIRGPQSRLSSHSFGTAIDLNIVGHLDHFTDGKTQLGLILLADFLREEGWVWGAGFRREDSMHFEVSREKLEEWRRMGVI